MKLPPMQRGFECKHNLNYWRFGDYLAIGCGAHGKVSFEHGDIIRYSKTKHPKGYMRGEICMMRNILKLKIVPNFSKSSVISKGPVYCFSTVLW
ncbi:oxygen-independent coproporphyrinogen-III oxidase-like protein [Pasteurella canis]|uniref:Oxygen-independent coproporphyrinogen-III oxidase-like protein n=1 Tax=Pasteurella canis TaxID=753 RepID=A0A379ERQ3_9PAST|nr:oxygen-independent coproporphyrinogen-III oxidase-like protein [Pasteurella canis]